MLRPLSLGEILDVGIKVVTRNWKPLLVTLLIVTTPIDILTVFVLASFGDSELTFKTTPDRSQPAETPGAEFWLSLAVTGLLSTLASLFARMSKKKGE